MQLQFSGLLPLPLEEMSHSNHSFWQHGNLVLNPSYKYEIIASSGKGKTTFLDIIFGRRFDYKGQYKIDNQSVGCFSLNRWAELRRSVFSYVFQGLRLFNHLTGFENIQIKNRLSNTLTEKNILEYANVLEIGDQLGKKVGYMSYGQQQRLAMIRAFAQPFHWLLLDEPFSHLDPNVSKVATQLIEKICIERNAGVIITRLTNEDFIEIQQQIVL